MSTTLLSRRSQWSPSPTTFRWNQWQQQWQRQQQRGISTGHPSRIRVASSYHSTTNTTSPLFLHCQPSTRLTSRYAPSLLLHPSHRRHYAIKPVLSVGKALSRVGVAVGGTVAATVTYYQSKLNDWTNGAKQNVEEALEWLRENVDLPGFSDFSLPEVDLPDFSFPSIFGEQEEQGQQSVFAIPIAEEDAEVTATVQFDNAPAANPSVPVVADPFMVLTKKLLEVRRLLKDVGTAVDGSTSLKLPAIVVIGSQSSGKSSLLEAIVGHDFLPKGNNMVTRRPIEITLVHMPDSSEEYAEFPKQQLGKLRDFNRVRDVISELNRAVSEEDCVSDDPIDLRIFSANVPDLTLIDLPGYIAISNRKQPPLLKQKISQLCQKYIQEPNIILAVCSADVDLANSEALNESRQVDPKGSRTLGVLTKLDLVEPERAVALLRNEDYHLELGYVGVICKEPFSEKPSSDLVKYQRLLNAEDKYFRSNFTVFAPVGEQLGIRILRRTMITVLEKHLARSLTSITGAVRKELEDAKYQFKVQFNDRSITAESYVTQLLDEFKTKFKEIETEFRRPQIRSDIRDALDEAAIQLCSDLYWNDPNLADIVRRNQWTEDDWKYWQLKFDTTHAMFTKAGIGRSATQLILDRLIASIQNLATGDVFAKHRGTQKEIYDLAMQILQSKFHTTVEQVENTIKPYKYDVEFTASEWDESLARSITVLEKNLKLMRDRIEDLRSQFGRRKLRAAMQYLEAVQKRQQQQQQVSDDVEGSTTVDSQQQQQQQQQQSAFSPKLLAKANDALQLQIQMNVVNARILTLRSSYFSPSMCAAKYALTAQETPFRTASARPDTTTATHSTRPLCPEPYLILLSDKIASTAALFIAMELLTEFFYLFPRDLDQRMRSGKTPKEITDFARDNDQVKNHLEAQARKEALEKAMDILSQLQQRKDG